VRGGACVRGGCEARRGASAGRSGAPLPVLVAHEAGESCSIAGKIARAQVGVRGPAASQLDAAALRDLAGEVRSMATMATGPQVLQAVGAVRRVPLAALLRVRHASRAASTGRRRRSLHSPLSPGARSGGARAQGHRSGYGFFRSLWTACAEHVYKTMPFAAIGLAENPKKDDNIIRINTKYFSYPGVLSNPALWDPDSRDSYNV
jgi:hypothetical protein